MIPDVQAEVEESKILPSRLTIEQLTLHNKQIQSHLLGRLG